VLVLVVVLPPLFFQIAADATAAAGAAGATVGAALLVRKEA
jgi:hypothetical protein